jgi:anaerobic selenocysteine-containing dehydrogenase
MPKDSLGTDWARPQVGQASSLTAAPDRSLIPLVRRGPRLSPAQLDARAIHPDHPINQGTLCPKGITLKQNIVNDRRLTKVLYRAPGSAAWEEKDWDFALDRMARLVKDTRDRTLRRQDEAGRTLNALTSIGVIGGCTDTNELNYLLVKTFRAGLGVVPLEQQARI